MKLSKTMVCLLWLCLAAIGGLTRAVAEEPCSGEGCSAEPEPEETPPPSPPPAPPPSMRVDGGNNEGAAGAASVALSAAAPSGAPEYVLVGSEADMAAGIALAVGRGAVVLRQERLGSIGVAMTVLDLGRKVPADELRRRFQSEGIALSLSRNSSYGMAEGPRVYASAMVGLEAASPCFLSQPVAIGLLDGPVDAGAPALQGVAISSHSVLEEGDEPATADHATALAGLIASPGASSGPAGIAPGARIMSVVAFARSEGRNLAHMDRIASALDWLAMQGVNIVNLSLSGPRNDTLAYVLGAFSERGMIMIAATGNEGGEVAYPASDPNVLAISAVDARERPYARANMGADLDFVAPGVDILVDEGGRLAYRSGTSYAAAIATGLVAQLFASHGGSADELIARLRSDARDLGTPGRDRMFGWGLLRLNGCPALVR